VSSPPRSYGTCATHRTTWLKLTSSIRFYDGSTYAADLAKELRLAGAMGADDIHLKECFNMTYEAHYNIKDAHIAHSEKLVLEYYESQAQVQKVHDFYIDDYEIFNIPWPPEWFHSLPP